MSVLISMSSAVLKDRPSLSITALPNIIIFSFFMKTSLCYLMLYLTVISVIANLYWFFVQSSLIPVLITQLRILLPYPDTMEKDEVHRYLLIIIVMATAYKC